MKTYPLENRSLIEISGEDAETFLDNLITCSVIGMEINAASFGALLTPQGKILFDFFLVKTEQGYLIEISSELAEEFVKRFMFYRLRAKVNIEENKELHVSTAWGEGSVEGDYIVSDPRHHALGLRIYSKSKLDEPHSEELDYKKHRISLGIAEGGIDFEYGDAYPHEVLMDQFGGVDFKKGCYVGQEVVSRMQHRGTTKKRVVHIESIHNLPESGTTIMADGKPAGKIGSVHGNEGLALIRLDRVAKAKELIAENIQISARIQDWVSFDYPEAQ